MKVAARNSAGVDNLVGENEPTNAAVRVRAHPGNSCDAVVSKNGEFRETERLLERASGLAENLSTQSLWLGASWGGSVTPIQTDSVLGPTSPFRKLDCRADCGKPDQYG